METDVANIPHYDLSDYRYQQTEITLTDGRLIKGQFVQFSVADGVLEIFPSSSNLCFLPAQFKKEFWDFFNYSAGIFPELPKYILLLNLRDITKIVIEPLA